MRERASRSSPGRDVDELDRARAREYALLATLLARSPDTQLIGRLALLQGDATPLGMAPSPDRQHMLELEALQISQQSHDIERLLIDFNLLDPKVANDPQIVLSPQVRQVVEALLEHPTISRSLKCGRIFWVHGVSAACFHSLEETTSGELR